MLINQVAAPGVEITASPYLSVVWRLCTAPTALITAPCMCRAIISLLLNYYYYYYYYYYYCHNFTHQRKGWQKESDWLKTLLLWSK